MEQIGRELGDGNEALFINLLCKQHHIGPSDGTCSVVEGGGTEKGREETGGK